MSNSIRFKLFLMMVLELFIWGAWLPLIYGYLPSLGFTPGQQSWILNAFPISAIIGMFFSTQFADRHFSAEKFMAFSHLVGGAAILGLAFINPPLPVPGSASGPRTIAPVAPFKIHTCPLATSTASGDPSLSKSPTPGNPFGSAGLFHSSVPSEPERQ